MTDRMAGRTLRKNVCSCIDCNGDGVKGRAQEKREYRKEVTEALKDEIAPRRD